MKRALLSLLFLLLASLGLEAQIFISEDMLRKTSFKISLEVQDSLSREPVGYATAYLQPKGDTLITAFCLTDAEGKGEMKKVTRGEYLLSVEMLGYRKYSKNHYFKEDKNLGTILLQPDAEVLDAATISAIGNPIEVRGDTVIYNASSFRVLDNAMLKDLIEKMPGMEITSDGKVKHNGVEIDRLTVGGKTFFFDQATALNNLPARFVDKVKVIDQESEKARFSGVSDGKKEKVMDIDLKEEYKKGWFGSLAGGGGMNFQNPDNPLAEKNKGVFNGNGMFSLFNERDQLTVTANGSNAPAGNGATVFVIMDDNFSIEDAYGLTTQGSAGVNLNTDRIPGVETNVNFVVKSSSKDAKQIRSQTEFGSGTTPDHFTHSTSSSLMGTRSVTGGIELKKKEKNRYSVSLENTFRYSDTDRSSVSGSEVSAEEVLQSTSSARTHSRTGTYATNHELDLGLKNLFGKERRSLTISANLGLSGTQRTREEWSEIIYTSSGTSLRDLSYDLDRKGRNLYGEIAYTEPFGEYWTLQAEASVTDRSSSSGEDAFNADGSKNDYYSSLSDNRTLYQQYVSRIQFKKDKLNAQVGGTVLGTAIDNYSKSFGKETSTGGGEWDWTLSPYLRVRNKTGVHEVSLYANTYVRRPSDLQLTPMLDQSNPARLSIGNIYLRPGVSNYYSLRDNFSYLDRQISGDIELGCNTLYRPVTTASWFDTDGIMFSVPVNAERPAVSWNENHYFSVALGSEKLFTLSGYGNLDFGRSSSYQNVGAVPTPDVANFVYADFMDSFWGTDGSKFYGGESGFHESRTRTSLIMETLTLTYKGERLDLSLSSSFKNSRSEYSLDSRANSNFRDWSVHGEATYSAPKEWTFNTSVGRYWYRGYEEGFGIPYTMWNFSINKGVKDYTLSLYVRDILGQSRFSRSTASENSVSTMYYNSLGRYFIISFSWHFGKSGSKHASRARDAQWNLLW